MRVNVMRIYNTLMRLGKCAARNSYFAESIDVYLLCFVFVRGIHKIIYSAACSPCYMRNGLCAMIFKCGQQKPKMYRMASNLYKFFLQVSSHFPLVWIIIITPNRPIKPSPSASVRARTSSKAAIKQQPDGKTFVGLHRTKSEAKKKKKRKSNQTDQSLAIWFVARPLFYVCSYYYTFIFAQRRTKNNPKRFCKGDTSLLS